MDGIMKAVGIIAEYNPFHNGHLHQIRHLKETLLPGAAVVAFMSGSFTQRGEITCIDKWSRAKAAIRCGADLVFELPTIFCTSSADLFAEGGIRCITATGIIDTVLFGSESGDLAMLRKIADFLSLAEVSDDFQQEIRTFMREGSGYASAVSAIVKRELGFEAAQLMKQPNNILGISYLKAQSRLEDRQSLQAITHGRVGESHLSSASDIREICRLHRHEPALLLKAVSAKLPPASGAALVKAAQEGELRTTEDLDAMIYSLLRRSSVEDIQKFHGMKDGLAERLIQAAERLPANFSNGSPADRHSLYDRLVDAASARQLSRARIQRALASLVLGITDEDREIALTDGPQYLRALAFNRDGQYLLKQISRSAHLPLITKASDFREHNSRGRSFRRQYTLDLIATDVRDSLGASKRTGRDFDTAVLIR